MAIANDATYGHDVTRTTRADGGTTTTARLSLVRAPKFPDPEADQGPHRMSYTLVPGATIADAVAAGYALNLPLRVTPAEGSATNLAGRSAADLADGSPAGLVDGPTAGLVGGPAAGVAALVGLDESGARIEAVKLADDASGDVIVRVYEALGGRATTRLRTSFPITAAELTDLLERPLGEQLEVSDGVPLSLRPFQVLTIRLSR